jgi:hypothetical protein
MKQELSDQLRNMCDSCDVSPRVECFILELMYDAYHNGWEDGRTDSEVAQEHFTDSLGAL